MDNVNSTHIETRGGIHTPYLCETTVPPPEPPQQLFSVIYYLIIECYVIHLHVDHMSFDWLDLDVYRILYFVESGLFIF